MPRPNLASISINNNSRFDSDIYYSEIDYVRCINIIKKHVLRNNYSSSNSSPLPLVFFFEFLTN